MPPIAQVGYQILAIINNVLVPLIFAVAFIVFIWGIFNYFIAGGANEEKRKEGRSLIVWGLIGFFVMISVWGLVNILVYSFGLNHRGPASMPGIGGGTGGGGAGGFGGGYGSEGSIYYNIGREAAEGTFGLFDLFGGGD